MNLHYVSLITCYALVTGLWFLINFLFPSIWKNSISIKFKKPSLEFFYSIVAVIGILGIGQLYMNDLLIPGMDNNVFIDMLNQILIFSPVFVLLLIRKHSLQTLWFNTSNLVIRLIIGLFFAFSATLIYWIINKNSIEYTDVIKDIYSLRNSSYFIQVLLEDLTIALLFVRLSAWIGNKWSILIVAVLFAAGHIPALIANGDKLVEMLTLVIDTFIGVMVLTALSRSKDIIWFFFVHFAMDMTQFLNN